jgi:hypothetical protein
MQQEHAALDKALESLTPDQLTRVSQTTKWSIKDVLAHLLAWEQMCLGWHQAGLRGIILDILPHSLDTLVNIAPASKCHDQSCHPPHYIDHVVAAPAQSEGHRSG